MIVHHKRFLDTYRWILLIVPIVLLLINDQWCFTQLRFIDPWFYLGFSLNYPDYAGEWFQNTYYGSRLPAILPSFLAHKLLPPLAANYVVHLAVYYLAIFSLDYVLAAFISRKAAFATALFLGCYARFAGAVGSDYVDGTGIAFQLLALVFLIKAVKAENVRWWLCASGAAAAAMVHTHLLLFFYSPIFVILFLVLSKSARGKTWLAILMEFLPPFIAGAVSLTAMLGLINLLAGGAFFFFAASLQFAKSMSSVENPWRKPLAVWLPEARHLALALAMLVSSLIYVVRVSVGRSNSVDTNAPIRWAVALCLAGMSLTMVGLEALGQPILQYEYHPSYLIPLTFLGLGLFVLEPLGAVFWSSDNAAVKWPRRAAVVLTGGLLLAWVIPDGWREHWGVQEIYNTPPGLTWALCAGGTAMVLLRIFRPLDAWTEVLALLGSGLVALAAGSTFLPLPQPARDSFVAVVAANRLVSPYIAERPHKFWYSKHAPLANDYLAISSTFLWQYSLVNDELPTLTKEQAQTLHNYDRLLLMTEEAAEVIKAQAALQACGFVGRRVEDVELPCAAGSARMYVLELSPLNGVTLKATEAGPWELVLTRTSSNTVPLQNMFEPRGQSTTMVTAAETEALVFQSREPTGAEILASRSLAATQEGRYAFSFRYAIQRGRVKIRFRDEGGAQLAVASDVRTERAGITRRRMYVDLRKGQRFRVVVECGEYKDEVQGSLLEAHVWRP